MQPAQFILHATLTWFCSAIITRLLLGEPISGNAELHAVIFFTLWITSVLCYLCGYCARGRE